MIGITNKEKFMSLENSFIFVEDRPYTGSQLIENQQKEPDNQLIQQNLRLKEEILKWKPWQDLLCKLTNLERSELLKNPTILKNTSLKQNLLQLLTKIPRILENQQIQKSSTMLLYEIETLFNAIQVLQQEVDTDTETYYSYYKTKINPSGNLMLSKYDKRKINYDKIRFDRKDLENQFANVSHQLHSIVDKYKGVKVSDSTAFSLKKCTDPHSPDLTSKLDEGFEFVQTCDKLKDTLNKAIAKLDKVMKDFEFSSLYLLAMIDRGKLISLNWFKLGWIPFNWYSNFDNPIRVLSPTDKSPQENTQPTNMTSEQFYENTKHIQLSDEARKTLKNRLYTNLDLTENNPMNFICRLALKHFPLEIEKVSLFESLVKYMYFYSEKQTNLAFEDCMSTLKLIESEHTPLYNFFHSILHFYHCQASLNMETEESAKLFKAIYRMDLQKRRLFDDDFSLPKSIDLMIEEYIKTITSNQKEDLEIQWAFIILSLVWLPSKDYPKSDLVKLLNDILNRSYSETIKKVFQNTSLKFIQVEISAPQNEYIILFNNQALFTVNSQEIQEIGLFVLLRHYIYCERKVQNEEIHFDMDLATLGRWNKNPKIDDFLHVCLHYFCALKKIQVDESEKSRFFQTMLNVAPETRHNFDKIVASEHASGLQLHVNSELFDFGRRCGLKVSEWGLIFLRLSRTRPLEHSRDKPVLSIQEHKEFIKKMEEFIGISFQSQSWWIKNILFHKNLYHNIFDYVKNLNETFGRNKMKYGDVFTLSNQDQNELTEIMSGFTVDGETMPPQKQEVKLSNSSFRLNTHAIIDDLQLLSVYGELQAILRFFTYPHFFMKFSLLMPKPNSFEELFQSSTCKSFLHLKDSFTNGCFAIQGWQPSSNENTFGVFEMSYFRSIEKNSFAFVQVPLHIAPVALEKDEKLCEIIKRMVQIMGEEDLEDDEKLEIRGKKEKDNISFAQFFSASNQEEKRKSLIQKRDQIPLELSNGEEDSMDNEIFVRFSEEIPQEIPVKWSESEDKMVEYIHWWIDKYPHIQRLWNEYNELHEYEKKHLLYECFKFVHRLKIASRKAIWDLPDEHIKFIEIHKLGAHPLNFDLKMNGNTPISASSSIVDNVQQLRQSLLKKDSVNIESKLSVKIKEQLENYKVNIKCEYLDDKHDDLNGYQVKIILQLNSLKDSVQSQRHVVIYPSEFLLHSADHLQKHLTQQCLTLLQRLNK